MERDELTKARLKPFEARVRKEETKVFLAEAEALRVIQEKCGKSSSTEICLMEGGKKLVGLEEARIGLADAEAELANAKEELSEKKTGPPHEQPPT